MSMAAGEYVSVSSQSDTEQADLARERRELAETPDLELDELTAIYVKRGVAPDTARQVAFQLMEKDALTAHARDELGISEISTARPIQAALTSAATFAAGAAMPLIALMVAPPNMLIPITAGAALFFLQRSERLARRPVVPDFSVRCCALPSGAPSRWLSQLQSENFSVPSFEVRLRFAEPDRRGRGYRIEPGVASRRRRSLDGTA
jgi:hypothetical protein